MRPSAALTPNPAGRQRWRALALLVVLLGSALWLARANLLGWLAERALTAKGLGPATVEVLALSRSHATLAVRGSALGSIERIDVDYRFGPGLRIEHVRATGARLQLAWRDGQLFPAIVADDSGAPAPGLPIELIDTQVTLRVGATLLNAQLAGHIESGALPAAQLRFEITAPQAHGQGTLTAHSLDNGELEGTLTLTNGDLRFGALQAQGLAGQLRARQGPSGLTAVDGRMTMRQLMSPQQSWGAGSISITQPAARAWRLGLEFTPLKLNVHSQQTDAQARRTIAVDGRLDAHFLGALVPGMVIAGGEVKFDARGDMPAATASLAEALRDGTLEATARIDAKRLTLRDVAELDAVAATLDCALAAGAFTCDSKDGIRLTGLDFAQALVADDSVLAGPGALTIAAQPATPLLELSTAGDGAALALGASVSLQTARLALRAPLTARLSIDPSPAAAGTTRASRGSRRVSSSMAITPSMPPSARCARRCSTKAS